MTPPPVPGSGLPPTNLPISRVPRPLDVVAVVSNPYRFRSRYALYRSFARHVEASGARLTTVESALGDRPFEVTEADNPRHLQVRTSGMIWDKESLINLGVSRLPADWEYLAWVDADVAFARPDWVQETLHQLQVHRVVQLWSHALDLGPAFEPIQEHRSFASLYLRGERPAPGAYTAFMHPGFAWAMRRDAYEAVGGLIDWAILGAADHHMATALIGRVEQSIHGGVTRGYRDAALAWQARAEQRLRHDLGCVDGTIVHMFHGAKSRRRYQERWQILIDGAFDPAADLRRGDDGLWVLTEDKPGLRDGIRAYFAQRDEDSTTLDAGPHP